MQLPPLTEGVLVRRYKRFLADIDFGGEVETVHCPNPGAMTGLNHEGMRVWCSSSDNPARKLSKTLELVESEGELVGINTNRPNAIVAEALAAGEIASLARYRSIRREYTWRKGVRFDVLLEDADDGSPPMLLEIKNVHLKRSDGPNADAVEFPDSVTARGAKHLDALAAARAEGLRAGLLFVIQRMDGDRMCIAADIDPVYAAAFAKAVEAGVEMMAHRCRITTDAITLGAAMPIEFKSVGLRSPEPESAEPLPETART